MAGTEIVWPTKLRLFTVLPFAGEVGRPLVEGGSLGASGMPSAMLGGLSLAVVVASGPGSAAHWPWTLGSGLTSEPVSSSGKAEETTVPTARAGWEE